MLSNSVSASVGTVLIPAGLDNSKDIITAQYIKDPTDPQWQKGPEWDEWLGWMKKYQPSADVKDVQTVYGYTVAQGLVQVLKQAGLTGSTSEAMRMIEQGAVRLNGERAEDKARLLAAGETVVMQVGKRKFAAVVLE